MVQCMNYFVDMLPVFFVQDLPATPVRPGALHRVLPTEELADTTTAVLLAKEGRRPDSEF